MSTNNPTPHNPGHTPADSNPLAFFPAERHPLTLTRADAAAFDLLLDPSEQRPGDAPIDPARLARAQLWLATLAAAPAAQPSPNLLARTLHAAAHNTPDLTPPRRLPDSTTLANGWQIGRRVGEFATMAVAAGLLIAVLIPGLASARQSAKRAACAGNLATLGTGFQTYSADNTHQLPDIGRSQDGNWLPRPLPLDNGTTQTAGHSNAANLLLLLREGRVTAPTPFICPARGAVAQIALRPDMPDFPDRIRGYSYINLFGTIHPTWDEQPSTIIVADRNPLFTPAAPRNPFENSPNHGSRGTNILAADRSVRWTTTPNVGPDGDNIWTLGHPTPQITYAGTEFSTIPTDIFLSP